MVDLFLKDLFLKKLNFKIISRRQNACMQSVNNMGKDKTIMENNRNHVKRIAFIEGLLDSNQPAHL